MSDGVGSLFYRRSCGNAPIGMAYPKQEQIRMKGLSPLCPIEFETNMPRRQVFAAPWVR